MNEGRVHPKMGDALLVGIVVRSIASDTFAAIGECECGNATYTAVSFSDKSARAILLRKHRRHLPKCEVQAQLIMLDEMTES